MLKYLFALTFICSSQLMAQDRSDAQKVLDYVNDSIYYDLDGSLKRINSVLDKALSDESIKAKLLSRKALILDIQGEFEACIDNYHKALELQKSILDSNEISFIYNNMGVAYYDRYRPNEAILFYLKSARIDSARGLIEDYIASMQNIGVIYSGQNNSNAADSIYNALIPLAKSAGYNSILTPLYSNKTKLYVLSNDLESARKSIDLAYSFLQYSQDPSSPLTLAVLKGNILLRQNKHQEALEILNADTLLNLAANFPEREMYIDELKAQLYFSAQKVDSALFYYDKFMGKKDSLLNIDTQSKVEEIRSKYKLAEKDKELAKAKAIDAQQKNVILEEKEKSASNRAQRNLLIALVAVLGIIILFFVQRYRAKQNEKRILEDKIKAKEELLELKESMMGEIHHRIKNNLQLVSSMLVLQGNLMDEPTKQKFEESRKRIESISKVHEQLYTSSNYEYLNIKVFIDELCNELLVMSKHPIKLKIDSFNKKVHVDTIVPIALIINEWVTNSIKYAFDEDELDKAIEIKFALDGDKLLLTYSDSGKGIKDGALIGFGSMMVKSLCRQLKAKLSLEDRKGFYSKLEITKFKLENEVDSHS